MEVIKPIEQDHNGYRTRSTLEARWMVFFDNIKLSYHYEYQGYDLDGLWYLPDFYIPKWKCYFEVKDTSLPYQEARHKELKQAIKKAWLLRDFTNHKVIISFGGFGSKAELCAVFVPGDLEVNCIPSGVIYGYGQFGVCNGVDVLHLHTLPPEEAESDVSYLRQLWTKMPSDQLDKEIDIYKKWSTSKYLIPLHSSIGFDFAMIRELTGKRVFAPFSDPLFGSYNAQFFNKFKPYTGAYNAAKQYRFDRRGKTSG